MNEAQKPVPEMDPHRKLERIANLYELGKRICPGLFKGVHKFRTIEEHNAFRLEWIRERAKHLDERRQAYKRKS
jgi:hypothetical protein